MAIFKDENSNLYIGILYTKSNDLFSGNFIKISKRVFNIMSVCNYILIRFMTLTILAIFFAFLCKIEVYKDGDSDALFGTIAIIIAGIAVIYYALFPILLSRNKVALNKIKMNCITKQSVEIYVLTFMFSLALFLDATLSGFIRLNSFLLLFTLIPIGTLSGLAIYFYSKPVKDFK